MNEVYLGIDNAKVMGVALWYPHRHSAYAYEVKGTPGGQLSEICFLCEYISPLELTVVMEKQHYFRNAKTIRSLLEGYGYIKYNLLDMECRVEEVSPDVARAALGVKGKQGMFDKFLTHYRGTHLTNNHTDALAVAIYQSQLDGIPTNWNKLTILDLEREVLP